MHTKTTFSNGGKAGDEFCSNNGPKHFLPGMCTCQIMCHRKKGKKEGRQKGGKEGLWKEGRKNSLNTRKKN